MSQNSFGSPVVYINGDEITYDTIKFSNVGGNRPSKVTIKSSDINMSDSRNIGSTLVLYLNAGCLDSTPIFRGMIRTITPSQSGATLIAIDLLGFLTGDQAVKLNLTDFFNYDGFTITQFLHSYIEKYININQTLIGLDYLKETDPVVTLSGYRTPNSTPIRVINDNIKISIENQEDIKKMKLGVIHGSDKSYITFFDEQDINSAGILLTYDDGVKSVSFRKRRGYNLISGKVENKTVTYQHSGSLNDGVRVKNISRPGGYKDPDDFRKAAYMVAKLEEQKTEIKLEVDKGFYLNIGNIVNLRLRDYPELDGKHRVVSKDISISKSNIKCNLSLSKELPPITDYLNTGDTVIINT